VLLAFTAAQLAVIRLRMTRPDLRRPFRVPLAWRGVPVPSAVGALATALVFVVALLQAVVFSSTTVLGGAPDLLLVTIVAVGLIRGSVVGAFAGFGGGLVVDLVTLDTLGVTSLVLILAGFWAGRYGETTGRGRGAAPVTAVAVITVLAAIFGFARRYLLGEEVIAHQALITALLPALVMNVLLAFPIHRLVRRTLGERYVVERTPEVELVV
jgi:rod shape-determining protein MreD